jgi:HEAT repeat protein
MESDSELRIQKLIRRLEAPDPVVRLHAAVVLGDMGVAAAEAVPTLIGLLKSDSAADRKRAAWTLGHLGAAAAPAVPILTQCLCDSDPGVRAFAEAALEKLAPASQLRVA